MIWTSRYVARSPGASAFYPVLVHRLARLLDASFRPRLATVALASSLGLHLHPVGQRTFTSKLLSNAQHTTKPLARRPLRVPADAFSCPQRFILGYTMVPVCDPYALHEDCL